jgi:hypothetical protein
MTRHEARNVGSYEISQAFYLTTFGHLTLRGHSARAASQSPSLECYAVWRT